MKPFFSFYGSKWWLAPQYPKPEHSTIIEPFSGSAGYSVRHYNKDIILIEKDPILYSIWDYLIKVTPEEVRSLPNITMDQTVDDLKVCQEAKWLIGLSIVRGNASPCKKPSSWMEQYGHWNSFWGEKRKEILAEQVPKIKHWKVINAGYEEAPDIHATWFIDPPYQTQGYKYKFSSKLIDFNNLAQFCQSRQGQVMVCENEGAEWLPFQPFTEIYGTTKKKSKEVIWTNEETKTNTWEYAKLFE